jgi:hypothetical protein
LYKIAVGLTKGADEVADWVKEAVADVVRKVSVTLFVAVMEVCVSLFVAVKEVVTAGIVVVAGGIGTSSVVSSGIRPSAPAWMVTKQGAQDWCLLMHKVVLGGTTPKPKLTAPALLVVPVSRTMQRAAPRRLRGGA